MSFSSGKGCAPTPAKNGRPVPARSSRPRWNSRPRTKGATARRCGTATASKVRTINRTVSFWGGNEGRQNHMTSVVTAYPAGGSVPVYYDPQNPAEAVLDPTQNTGSRPLVIYAMGMMTTWPIRLRRRRLRALALTAVAQSNAGFVRRKPLTLARRFLPSMRRSREALVGLVGRRGTGGIAARRMRSIRRSSASWRLRAACGGAAR